MIDILVDTERHLRVGAVRRTRGCIHQMFDVIAATAFYDVQEARHVAFNVDVRIFYGMAHAGLRSQVNDPPKFFCREQGFHSAAVCQLELGEAKILERSQ